MFLPEDGLGGERTLQEEEDNSGEEYLCDCLYIRWIENIKCGRVSAKEGNSNLPV